MIGSILTGLFALPAIYFGITYIIHLVNLKNYPNGLFPIPVIGNLHKMSPVAYKDFANWAKKYGDVFSISFGMKRVVIVNAYEQAKEVLITKSKLFAGRDTSQYLINLYSNGFRDLTFSDYGTEWTFLRKLAHMGLRAHGDGKKMNMRLLRERDELIKRLTQANGKPVSVKEQLGKYTYVCIICMC